MTLFQQQQAFTQFLRDPDSSEPVNDNLAIYQHLVFNNMDGLLTGTFPVICSLLDEKQWQSLVRLYIRTHEAKTPYFSKIAAEFVAFLNSLNDESYPPFLADLAAYEYAEAEIYTLESKACDTRKPSSIVAGSFIALASTTQLHQYHYPVHQISRDFIPANPLETPCQLVLCRDHELKVRFLECNPLSMTLLGLIDQNGGVAVDAIVQFIADSLEPDAFGLDYESLLTHALAFLNQLNGMGAIINFYPQSL